MTSTNVVSEKINLIKKIIVFPEKLINFYIEIKLKPFFLSDGSESILGEIDGSFRSELE